MLPETLFKALSDPTRLRTLLLITEEGEVCVCELTHALEASQPKISRHLASLREADIVQDRREGLWIHYSLHPELPAWFRQVLETTRDQLRQEEPFRTDLQRLRTMAGRPASSRCA
ncbi:MAG: metalloregulator ArsR/SmtB family transcription factor [Gammaproteobacteria bacterium]